MFKPLLWTASAVLLVGWICLIVELTTPTRDGNGDRVGPISIEMKCSKVESSKKTWVKCSKLAPSKEVIVESLAPPSKQETHYYPDM